MPTRPLESTHDSPSQPEAATAEFRRSSPESPRAEANAEPNRPVPDPNAAGVESPSADQSVGANGLPRQSEATAGLPPVANADDTMSGDQDIDTAGTAHDDLSPTKSM